MLAGLTADAEKRLITRAHEQIRTRRLDTPDDFNRDGMVANVTDRTKNPDMWVVHFSWKTRPYGSRWYGDYVGSRKAHASFLCGREDKQDWAVRVPGTITTVQKALDWITPAAIKKALAAKKQVFRQGDMFFLPLRMYGNDLGSLWGTRHDYNLGPQGIVISHPQHPKLTLPNLKDSTYGWRAIQQKQLGNWGERPGAD
jgi:hypothetical protein